MSDLDRFANLIKDTQLAGLCESPIMGHDVAAMSEAMWERTSAQTVRDFYSSLETEFELSEGVVQSVKDFAKTKLVSIAIKTLVISAKTVAVVAAGVGAAIGTALVQDISKIKNLGDKLVQAFSVDGDLKAAANSFYDALKTATITILTYIDTMITKGKDAVGGAVNTVGSKVSELSNDVINNPKLLAAGKEIEIAINEAKAYISNTTGLSELPGETQRIVVGSIAAVIGLVFLAIKVTKFAKSGKDVEATATADAKAIGKVTKKVTTTNIKAAK